MSMSSRGMVVDLTLRTRLVKMISRARDFKARIDSCTELLCMVGRKMGVESVMPRLLS